MLTILSISSKDADNLSVSSKDADNLSISSKDSLMILNLHYQCFCCFQV